MQASPHMPTPDSLDKKGNNPVLEGLIAMLGQTIRMDKVKKCCIHLSDSKYKHKMHKLKGTPAPHCSTNNSEQEIPRQAMKCQCPINNVRCCDCVTPGSQMHWDSLPPPAGMSSQIHIHRAWKTKTTGKATHWDNLPSPSEIPSQSTSHTPVQVATNWYITTLG